MGKRDESRKVLEYCRLPVGEPLWFRLLVFFGCVLGIGIIVAIVVAWVRHG